MDVHSQREPSPRADTLGRAVAPVPQGLRERIGETIGRLWAPAIAAISRSRSARMFHPRGLTFAGRCEAIVGGAMAHVGAQLEGRVLARCSQALWKPRVEILDVLGVALRFRPGAGPALDATPALGDQDLLFATIRSPFTMLGAPLATNAHDFLANRYWAVSPFCVHDEHRVSLRLVPVEPPRKRGPRDQRLREAVAERRAVFHLEVRHTLTRPWHAVARITLEREVAVDQEALRFDPFRSGAGIVPVGLVHAIRRAAYAASQDARTEALHDAQEATHAAP